MKNENVILEQVDEAIAIASTYSKLSIYSGYETGLELANDLQTLRRRVLNEDWSALNDLYLIFAPTCAWDDAIGVEGIEIANQIMQSLDDMNLGLHNKQPN